MWAILGLGGLLVVATGLLPEADARDIALERGAPLVAFLVAVTILAELADKAGVFDVAAALCARAARGSTATLFLLIAVLATVTTAVLSLDTTAVLLTPVVLALAERIGMRPLPFALLVVWLANTASLFLPISNLTNLLALQRLELSTAEFVARMAVPAGVAVAVTVGYLGVVFRRDLVRRYVVPDVVVPPDRVVFVVALLACLALAPAVAFGVPPWIGATFAATAVVGVFVVRRRADLTWSLLPWRLVAFTLGLFLVVLAIAEHGLTSLLTRLIGESPSEAALTAAVASNLFNNLPAYLALEPGLTGGDVDRHFGVLLGTNIGPLILIWGSLATLLWRERCKARGAHIGAARFAAIGLGGVPLVLGAAVLSMHLVG